MTIRAIIYSMTSGTRRITFFVFRETHMRHLLIWGNAYTQVIREGNDRVLFLYPLLPDKMESALDEQGQPFYTYIWNTGETPNFNEYGRVRLWQKDVLHISGLGFDGLLGYSPIAMAENILVAGDVSDRSGAILIIINSFKSVI